MYDIYNNLKQDIINYYANPTKEELAYEQEVVREVIGGYGQDFLNLIPNCSNFNKDAIKQVINNVYSEVTLYDYDLDLTAQISQIVSVKNNNKYDYNQLDSIVDENREVFIDLLSDCQTNAQLLTDKEYEQIYNARFNVFKKGEIMENKNYNEIAARMQLECMNETDDGSYDLDLNDYGITEKEFKNEIIDRLVPDACELVDMNDQEVSMYVYGMYARELDEDEAYELGIDEDYYDQVDELEAQLSDQECGITPDMSDSEKELAKHIYACKAVNSRTNEIDFENCVVVTDLDDDKQFYKLEPQALDIDKSCNVQVWKDDQLTFNRDFDENKSERIIIDDNLNISLDTNKDNDRDK